MFHRAGCLLIDRQLPRLASAQCFLRHSEPFRDLGLRAEGFAKAFVLGGGHLNLCCNLLEFGRDTSPPAKGFLCKFLRFRNPIKCAQGERGSPLSHPCAEHAKRKPKSEMVYPRGGIHKVLRSNSSDQEKMPNQAVANLGRAPRNLG